jgi:CheY-like chemotaxis protein
MKPDTKLVAISADIERATREESVAEGRIFDYYIVKPFKFSTLTAAIEGIVPLANRPSLPAE